MRPNLFFHRIVFVTCISLISLAHILSQDTCDGSTSSGSSRTDFGCPDLDELTAEEVQAMPIMYIPVIFHFVAYHDTPANTDVNFICDTSDPLYSVNPYLYAPTFVFYVMKEMNDRMEDQLLEDPLGITGLSLSDHFDTRIRYVLFDGPEWQTLLSDPDCSSFHFYDVGQGPSGNSVNSLPPDAVHIVVLDNGAVTSTGGVAKGGSANPPRGIELKNYARSYFKVPSNNVTSSAGRTLNHEVAHLFDLDHTWHCSNVCWKSIKFPEHPIDPTLHCCNQCLTHNGNPPSTWTLKCQAGDCYDVQSVFLMAQHNLTLTLCEHRLWWSERSSSSPFSTVDFCNESSEIETLIYDTGTKLEWEGQRLINADVIIKNGTEVEITCDIFMGAGKKIVVERGARLTVNGGSISGLCDYQWRGIILEGVSDEELLEDMDYEGQLENYDDPLDPDKAGTVVLLNASISEAMTGIMMANDDYSWPEYANYYGGLVYCENSTFFDCNRAAAFMMYGQEIIRDKSAFINCTFEDLDYGVSLWANSGVIFNSCDFLNCGRRGIVAYDSEISVLNGCVFEDNLDAIELFNVNPNPFGHTIGSITGAPNIFNGNHNGIYGTAQNSTKPNYIENNKFESGNYGIHFGGLSHFRIRYNSFNSLYSSQEIVAGGELDNEIYRNTMEENTASTHYVYENTGSTFINNCYINSDFADVLLNHSTIFPIIGTSSTSASNCFTLNSIPSIYCNSNEGTVRYFAHGNSSVCTQPIITNCSNVSAQNATGVLGFDCDDSPAPYNSPLECSIASTIPGILSAITSLDGSISTVQANTSYTTEEKIILISGYKKCRTTLIFKYVVLMVEASTGLSSTIDTLVEYLDNRPEFLYKMYAYGLETYGGNYSDARQYLNSLSPSNQDEEDFITVQNKYLDYLDNSRYYTSSQNTLDTLYDIGIKTHPYAGFARSLYHLLTNEKIEVEIPEVIGAILPRSSLEVGQLLINCYPNPVKGGVYNIQFKNNKSIPFVAIEIFDIQGRVVYSSKHNLNEETLLSISTESWLSSLYFVYISSDEGNILYSGKFTTIH